MIMLDLLAEIGKLRTENERLTAEKEMYRKAADADGFHRVLAARDAEIEQLRSLVGSLNGERVEARMERDEWKERWQAEHDDHQRSIAHFDKVMNEGP